ncbi:MAG: TetR/AcrR family transcriptional regulator [Opitutae bacterium]|nr:TetR/AcrR family transcriptional regulator [Opitutae bacterium]
MPRAPAPPPPPAAANPVTARIVRQARAHFFAHGYCQCTMDELAAELGMSKKTLYVHFASKEALMRAVIDDLGREIRAAADALFADRRLNFAQKLRGFAEGMVERLGRLNPRTMRDLQRFAPELHQRLAEMREKNIPYVFGRFIEQGQRTGMVRTDLDPAFAVQFFLQAMHGLLQPATMERLHLIPRELLPRAIGLLFGGLLTPAGRKEHEKLYPR